MEGYVNNNNNITYNINKKEYSNRPSSTRKFIAGEADLAVEGTSKMATETDGNEYTSPNKCTLGSKSSQYGLSSSEGNGSVVVPFVPETTTTFKENLDENDDDSKDKGCCLRYDNGCCVIVGRWWNVRYPCQRKIIEFVEKPMFHIFIVVFVLIDCFLVIAELICDLIKLRKPCHAKTTHSAHSHHGEDHHLELAIEILHFSSLALLAMFLIEVIVKVCAFGREWWNFHNKKMEWLDSIIVIASFIIDLWMMHKDNLIAEISLLFIAIRLWRFIRIINSVAQSIRSQDETRKEHLATTYVQVIELLLMISENKTNSTVELRRQMKAESFDDIIEKFTKIDQMCRHIIEHCPHPSSVNTVTGITHHLQEAMEQARLTSSSMNVPSKN
ncbi:unnamed protein product [Adineta steineri]|uniref:Voltage-gated hydrogen channel 1 n=1 Tax=Adineta steineri TaxID=433720 RepID=A0A814L491_9BILA|nr:unnamed protein product [Adineta steineri]